MAHTINRYFQVTFTNPNTPRVLVYPNKTTAAQLLNYHKAQGATVVEVAACIADNSISLPMPNLLMSAVDAKIQRADARALVVGLDAYLALLDTDGITAFMTELLRRLDANLLNADYLLSVHNKPKFLPHYEESLRIISIEDENVSIPAPLSIRAYSDKWVNANGVAGYKELLDHINPFEPSGNYTLILAGLTEKHAGISNAVSFVLSIRELAIQQYGLDADLDDATLEALLIKSAESGQSAESYLEALFGIENINTRLALKRLLELPSDNLWPAHIWAMRRRLRGDSYIAKVISEDVTHDNLLWMYIVGSAITAVSDVNAKKYAAERADALKAINMDYEPLIVDFIGQTKEIGEALQYLNCGTNAERIELVRRASKEDLSYGLPKQYAELFPSLADYLSPSFEYEEQTTTAYFSDYRKLKVQGEVTDNFVKRAYNTISPKIFPARDAVLAELRSYSDVALLVVDAMGAEYLPLLLALAKRCGINIESQAVVTVKLPTSTLFNPINWDKARILPEVRGVDNTVHDGAIKHEASIPERDLSETLRIFETTVMNRISNGLTRFARVAVTADHGASRLAVIAHNENKGITLPWDKSKNGQPDDWRYSRAPQGIARPPEYEQEYFPDTKETYWIVRGYNRLPKNGGKIYELHGGATLEEQLVPIVVFTKKAVVVATKQPEKRTNADVSDEFEGLI